MNDSQKYENYSFVQSCIETIQTRSVSDTWIEFQKNRLNEYRQWIPNFAMINEDIRDITFRQTATNTELILDHLIKNEFDIKLYLLFNQYLKYLIDYFDDSEENTEEDDLACMFENFSLI